MLLLISSIAALFLGPALYRFAIHQPRLTSLIDGAMRVTVVALVAFAIAPRVLTQLDLRTAGFFALGVAAPTVAERLFHHAARRAHAFFLLLALLGLCFHSVLDGTALAEGGVNGQGHWTAVAYAILLHQPPVGLMIWWLLQSSARWVPAATLGAMALSTVLGYFAEPAVMGALPSAAAGWVEAVVGGTLIHVALHQSADRTGKSDSRSHVH